jgi:SAM-dependent methyltransferase
MVQDFEEIADRFWNLSHKGEEESRRETLFMDDIILKAHLDREIESRLDGVRTVLDAGAGTGRFTIPLALRGLKVTHLDISLSMLKKAKENAANAGLANNMTFVHGRLGDLGRYRDRQFDLVIPCDAPISYTYPNHVRAVKELARISAKSIVLSVSSRFGALPYLFNPLQKKQYIIDENSDDPLVGFYLNKGESQMADWEPDFSLVKYAYEYGFFESPASKYEAFENGETPWPIDYHFLPEELSTILQEIGIKDIRLSGPGAFSRSIPNTILKKLLLSSHHRKRFLDLCYKFDSQPTVCGFGKDNLVASGLIA